jgi:transcriptional regulator with XRE-family HTH domain
VSTFISDGDVLERDGVEVRAQNDALLVTAPGGLLVQAVRCAGGWDAVIWPPGRIHRDVALTNRVRLLPSSEQDALRVLVGKRVASARKAIGFTQRGMAEYFTRSPSWVREIEGGAQWAPPYLLIPLAEATGVSVDWFYGRDPGAGQGAGSDTILPLRAELKPANLCPDHKPDDPGDYPEPPEDRYDLKDHS